MFERRLKIFLFLLAVVVIVLLGRAGQVQIVNRDYWKHQATEAMKLTHLVETTRGNIYDRNGKLLAVDKPCIDACIDYRALVNPPDPDWVRDRALDRLKTRMGEGWSALTARQKTALRVQEGQAVRNDIDQMWAKLAKISGRSIDDIDETRNAIVLRVQMRQRYVWYKRYEEAIKKTGNKVETADWKKFLTDGGDDAPAVDSFHLTVAEELESHVILPAIDTETQNALGKDIDQFPGLFLRPGTHRTYPYDDVACHLLGHLAHVDADDLKSNTKVDELRNYLRNDVIGKTGIEALCEPTLRGTRGQIDRALGEDIVLASKEPAPGQDVRLSIDIELQQEIQSAFASARLRNALGDVVEESAVLHGAAVVLDVKTNQVLALVSYPTYDQNQFDALYARLRDDEINDPLRNRATMSQLEPGSTVKPLCGMAGISQGVIGINEGIECTGVLRLNGRRLPFGRCWVDSRWGEVLRSKGMSSAHHPIPIPHVGQHGNPDGWLIFVEALERSCNIFFETVADRLGIERLSAWYSMFGLGRPTGIGIGEVKGRLPRDFPLSVPALRRSTGFLGGIGQGCIAVTPIQMANAAAMIARDGIWMRPVLILAGPDGKPPAMHPGPWQNVPDSVDLKLASGGRKPLTAEALSGARQGMFNVVNADAGTGKALVAGDHALRDLKIAGKTGTAQAARFSVPERDGAGNLVLDEHKHVKRRFIGPSTPKHPNPLAPWYRAPDEEGHTLNHAWFIGFAPADHPQVAFAVMVEYGGSGGVAAASIAREALEDCITRGYLPKPHSTDK